ncbi:Male-specific lethal 3-like protein [Frankliniella fusca]|uniref:Protein male-specific lethal-3 n=1 Tax=Frankliniella fusca TaxID=407009 RepID=A0AAE1H0J1_9NEOP|nr:Male-specific lethal 3-like protein [Frankliniella fusca]
MVSTRGPKFKFSEGERVLCYEPDPTKAKVLYDSKVLEVKVTKDQRGRKSVEFLIHFQGWNSSWDRCVSEDFVLKDTEENRQLQKDLAQKAQLQLCSNYRRGAYLYRKDRTKRRRKLSDRINDTLERQKGRRRVSTSASATSNSNASGTSASVDSDQDSVSNDEHDDENDEEEDEEDEKNAWGNHSSGESSDGGEREEEEELVEERIPMEISSGLKRLLEHDSTLINKSNKLLQLPAEPNIVTILEGFVKHCAVNQLCNSSTTAPTSSKNGQRHYKYIHNNKTQDLESICRNLNICKEVADGLRVYFDFTLGDLLLYSQEREQFAELIGKNESVQKNVTPKLEPESGGGEGITIKVEPSNAEHDPKDKLKPPLPSPPAHTSTEEPSLSMGENRKRSLRSSHRSVPDVTPSATPAGPSTADTHTVAAPCPAPSLPNSSSQSPAASPSAPPSSLQSCPTGSSPSKDPEIMSPQSNAILSQVMTWHLVPTSSSNESPPLPSLIYGATHLARLFVRLPDLLYTGNMPSSKLKVLTSHLETFMGYLEEHTEWFADHNYTDNPKVPAAD